MQVFLQHDGASTLLPCSRSIAELKEQIAGVSGVPTVEPSPKTLRTLSETLQSRQRLISCGRSLETDSCLEGL